jgi:prolyl-tRNA synthetase
MGEKLNLNKKNFTEWYDSIMFYDKILDDRYPLKGSYVWMPYGFKALKLMMRKMEELLDETGHEDSYFPLLVPMSIFKKEKDFLRGFGGSSLRITHVGDTPLDEEMIIRPTSETVMYYMFSLWIRSWRDLPMKMYQVVPVFRWETKMTKPMLRVREVVKFKEAHTVHETAEQADQQVKEGIEIYKKFFDFMKIPYVVLKTPDWGTFAGAVYNYDFISVMPDGKGIELASVINLGQKFAKSFDIKYLDKNGESKYVWQTCYGISERSLGVNLALHGDDKGLIFTSDIVPIQVVIIPIISGKEDDDKLIDKANEIKSDLKQYRVEIEKSDMTTGSKFFHWEAKGVPVRVEIGNRELKDGNVVLVRRDTGTKKTMKYSELKMEIENAIKETDQNMYDNAKKFFKNMLTDAKDIEEAQKILKDKGGLVKVPWCGMTTCGKEIEEKLVGDAQGIDENEQGKGICPVCKMKAKHMLYLGRTY